MFHFKVPGPGSQSCPRVRPSLQCLVQDANVFMPLIFVPNSTILHHVFMLVRSSSAVFAFLSESETKVADLSGLHSESGEIRDLRDPSPVP